MNPRPVSTVLAKLQLDGPMPLPRLVAALCPAVSPRQTALAVVWLRGEGVVTQFDTGWGVCRCPGVPEIPDSLQRLLQEAR